MPYAAPSQTRRTDIIMTTGTIMTTPTGMTITIRTRPVQSSVWRRRVPWARASINSMAGRPSGK